MRKVIENFFKLKDLNTSIRTEVLAGLTTFMAMVYIIFVNPAMISQTGMDFASAMAAACISAACLQHRHRYCHRLHQLRGNKIRQRPGKGSPLAGLCFIRIIYFNVRLFEGNIV